MSAHWSFFDGSTGELVGRTYSGPEAYLADNTPPGCVAIEGAHDHRCRRVNLSTGAVEPWQPPQPAADGWQAWQWGAQSERWLSVPTLAALARDARAERDRRMAAFAWRYDRYDRETRLKRTRTDTLTTLDAYMQALADVPTQPGFPGAITWPAEPA